jgi:D-aminoacyl-tRNA deacylase
MIGLIQRVSRASVSVKSNTVGQINQGLLALIGIERSDDQHKADRLLERMMNYRIFPDEEGKMNLSLIDIKAGLLLVPQFTLVADTKKGNRPGFSNGASPEMGKHWFEYLLKRAHENHVNVAAGVFGADMQVELINNGPVTFWLQT